MAVVWVGVARVKLLGRFKLVVDCLYICNQLHLK